MVDDSLACFFLLEFYVLLTLLQIYMSSNTSVNLSPQASALLALPVFFLYKLCSEIFWLVDSFYLFISLLFRNFSRTRGNILKCMVQLAWDLLGWLCSIKSKWIPFLSTVVPSCCYYCVCFWLIWWKEWLWLNPIRNSLILSA